MRCLKCGGSGKPGGCPLCGTDSNKLNIKESKKESFITSCLFRSIPENYIGRIWSKQILIDNHPERAKDIRFHEYCDKLERLQAKFQSGELYSKAAFIQAPSKMSKSVFAYSCMQIALNNGFTVAPLIDTIELKILLSICASRPDYKLNKWITYDNYITSDIVFVTVTKTDMYAEAYTQIIELLSRRSRLGLPTFIVSKFSTKEIASKCVDSDYEKLYDYAGNENDLKYPVIIEC